jgi:hypothetical protein
MDAKSEKKSLAQLRAEVKDLRKSLYKPISRSKKADLEAEIARHKGVSAPASTKSEAVAVPMVEEQPKPTKEEKKGKKAEPKSAKPKTEKKSEPKPKKETETKKKPVKKTEKKD